MIFELDPDNLAFPDASLADENGLVAIGGDLSPKRLLSAYMSGIFPWPSDEVDCLLWWSLDPRMILFPDEFRCSKSLRRVMRSGKFEVRIDTCFEQVIRGCQQTIRDDEDGTWITEDIVSAYVELHRLGFAHSFETFYHGRLVGGLYGVSIGNIFVGESMFHTMTDASKVAVSRLVDFSRLHGFSFIDAQQETSHLASLGARPIPRSDYLRWLDDLDVQFTLQGCWHQHSVVLSLGSNMGDRNSMLDRALDLLDERLGEVVLVSSIYETEPWGFECSDAFLNCAAVIDTDLTPQQVLEVALSVEKELGRVRAEDMDPATPKQYASRPIDIDIIFYDNEVSSDPALILPHPRMEQRAFVLRPLEEIIPYYIHPVLHKTMIELYDTCADQGEISIYNLS